MFMLTRTLVNSLIITSNIRTQEYNQSFSLILSLLLPTNIHIKQYCYSCTPQAESLHEKKHAGVCIEKREPEARYSSLISHGYPSCFFAYITKQSPEF